MNLSFDFVPVKGDVFEHSYNHSDVGNRVVEGREEFGFEISEAID